MKINKLGNTFTAAQAKKFGINQYQLKKLIHANKIEKIAHGRYMKLLGEEQNEKDNLKIESAKVVRKNAICLLSALSYYDITDQIPSKTWLLVSNETICKYDEIKLLRKRNPMWNIGIVKEDNLLITSIERTIIESIIYKKKIGTSTALSALKTALNENRTTVNKLFQMAKKMKVLNRVIKYLEVYS